MRKFLRAGNPVGFHGVIFHFVPLPRRYVYGLILKSTIRYNGEHVKGAQDTMLCTIKTGYHDQFLKVQIEGTATWENAKHFFDFVTTLIKEGKKKVLIDLSGCSYLDSTYCGVLAELAEFVKTQPEGTFYIANANVKLSADIKTIGLNKLIAVANDEILSNYSNISTAPGQFAENYSQIQKAKQILKSHQILESLSEHNKEDFKDVVDSFKTYIEEQGDNVSNE